MVKTCFVKSALNMYLSWGSLRYPGPRKLLDSFLFGAHAFSLMVALESDTWVIREKDIAKSDGGSVWPKDDPRMKLERAHQNIVGISEISWEEYDCVISLDPILGNLPKRYPRTLWCYYELSHACERAYEVMRTGRPRDGYDLYFDRFFRARSGLRGLPQIVHFPLTQSADILKGLIAPTNEPAVFIESRNIPKTRKLRARMRAELRNICGLPIRHAPFPEFGTVFVKFGLALVSDSRKEILNAADYLGLVGSCKYYLSWRKRRVAGQALVEAAALGLIIVAPSRSPYSSRLCHPTCLTRAGEPARVGLRRIRKIEANPDWQAEILAHQDKVLREQFWNEPLGILNEALEMKRAQTRSFRGKA